MGSQTEKTSKQQERTSQSQQQVVEQNYANNIMLMTFSTL
jgi:hypothetical protein